MTDDIAKRIAERIFTDGRGASAARLVLDYKDTMGGTGWCREAVADQIRAELAPLLAAVPIAEWCCQGGLIIRREWTGERYVEHDMGDAMLNQYAAARRGEERA